MSDYLGTDIYCDLIIPKKIKFDIVKETENVLAIKHTKPYWPIHIVVVPKKHIPSLIELSRESSALQQELLEVISTISKTVVGKEGSCRVLTNLGDYQDSKHLHFHIYSE